MLRLLAILALGTLLAGCAKNGVSVELSTLCAPPDDATSCSFAATCDAQYIGPVMIDTSATYMLWLIVQVNNQLPNNFDATVGRANTHDAFIQRFDVTFDTSYAVPPVTNYVDFTVPAAGSAVVSVYPVDAPAAAVLGASAGAGALTVVAEVVAKGIFADQSTFETAPMKIPIQVCNGCIGVPTCATGTPAVCPPNVGQAPLSVACP